VADPSYLGGPQIVDQGTLTPETGSVTLIHARLPENGVLMWMLVPEQVGAVLNQPVSHPTLPAGAAARLSAFDVAQAMDSARAEAQARVERDGSDFRVLVATSDARPGITFPSPAGGWSMAGLKALEATVKNTGKHPLPVHLALDGPDADRTHRKNCTIVSETISPGEQKTLVVPILPVPPTPVEWLRGGRTAPFPYPESRGKEGYRLARGDAISVYVYHPGREYSYEVLGLRAIPDEPGK
jgi:hypothetical protein